MANALKRTPLRRRPRSALSGEAKNSWKVLRTAGIEVLQSRSLEKFPWLIHGFSTRAGGASELHGSRVLNLGFADWDTRENVDRNRAKLLEALGAENMRLVPLRQIHSDLIQVFEAVPAEAPRGDAAITRTPGLLLVVQVADCIPILLTDPKLRVVAAVHSGWRGTLQRIASKAIGRMQMEFGASPADVIAVLGPGIGRCCYEVGTEVVKQFAGQFADAREWFDGHYDRLATGEEQNPAPWLTPVPPGHEPPPVRARLDLIAANRAILIEAGVRPSSILSSELCTACRTDLLFSYRREGASTGRLMAVIGLH